MYPLCVIPATPSGANGLTFNHPSGPIIVDSHVAELWEILAQCNGYQSIMNIVKKVASTISRESCEAIIDDLIKLEILVDSRAAFEHFHRLTSSPMPYVHNLTDAEIRQHIDSPHLPLHDGEAFKLMEVFSPLQNTLRSRYSCRSFDDSYSLTDEDISVLCQSAYGLCKAPVPSAGGLYPLALYIILPRRNGSFAAGYYQFDSSAKALRLLSDKVDIEGLEFAFNSSPLMYGASMVFVIAGDLHRQAAKYSNRGYRYTLLEAGQVAQNILLAAISQNIAALEYGGFLDERVHRELQLHSEESVLISLAIGKPFESPMVSNNEQLANLTSELVGRGKPVNRVQLTLLGKPDGEETFYAALAHYKAVEGQHTNRSFKERFTSGTATTTDLAKIKAIAEAYERYASGQCRVDAQGSVSELDATWLDPRDVVPWTNNQYANIRHLEPFDPNCTYQWTKGFRLRDSQDVYVPVELVYYPVSSKRLGRPLCYESNSSGVAAHTSASEAIERGLLELVERDAILRSWFTKTIPNKVPTSLLPYHWQRRIEYWQSAGYDVNILNQSRLGVVIANVIITAEAGYPCFISGASASLESFDQAVAKAFAEAELTLLYERRQPGRRHRIKPESVSSPTEHGILYYYPEHYDHVSWLISGNISTAPTPSASLSSLTEDLDPIVVELGGSDSPLKVFRTFSNMLIPMNFGFGMEHFSHPSIAGQLMPEMLRLPHYFA